MCALRATPAEALEAYDVRVHIRGVKAVDGVDLLLERGRILGLIGPNGAGKTTLVNVLAGFQRAKSGRVVLGDDDISTWEPSEIARAGLVRTFQDVRASPPTIARPPLLLPIRTTSVVHGSREQRGGNLSARH
jgi:ABC-type branched-subunit amino acid transport system ATPase component